MMTTTRATDLNLYVLSRTFGDSLETANRIPATSRPHIKRCVLAGLVEVAGASLRLTEAGKAALQTWRAKEAASTAKMRTDIVALFVDPLGPARPGRGRGRVSALDRGRQGGPSDLAREGSREHGENAHRYRRTLCRSTWPVSEARGRMVRLGSRCPDIRGRAPGRRPAALWAMGTAEASLSESRGSISVRSRPFDSEARGRRDRAPCLESSVCPSRASLSRRVPRCVRRPNLRGQSMRLRPCGSKKNVAVRGGRS